jgi:hypothetical protein
MTLDYAVADEFNLKTKTRIREFFKKWERLTSDIQKAMIFNNKTQSKLIHDHFLLWKTLIINNNRAIEFRNMFELQIARCCFDQWNGNTLNALIAKEFNSFRTKVKMFGKLKMKSTLISIYKSKKSYFKTWLTKVRAKNLEMVKKRDLFSKWKGRVLLLEQIDKLGVKLNEFHLLWFYCIN